MFFVWISSSDGMRDRGVGATVDVLEGVQRQLLRVREVRDVHRHPEEEEERKHYHYLL